MRTATMLLYTSQITPRIRYVTAFLGSELFEKDIEVTDAKEYYCSYGGPRINYSNAAVALGEFHIGGVGLLHETGVRALAIQCFEVNNYKAFFETAPSDFPFDILSAVFYLLSRYEEYLPFTPDKYGRYPHSNSLASKEGFLHQPLINLWLRDLKQALHGKFPSLQFVQRSPRLLPTYDIDIAWSYLNKGVLRNAGGMIASVLRGDWNRCQERLEVLLGKNTDPYHAYDWLNRLHLQCNIKACYFFLLARSRKKYDKNISPLNKHLHQLIKTVAVNNFVGVHPSWQSGDSEVLLREEVATFRKLSGMDTVQSRQHFLRFTLPETYRRLIKVGVDKDFSMGYGAINGFRASVASPFIWYDLEKEETSDLLVYPFCFMDTCAFYELQLSPEQAYEQMWSLFQSIKKVNGVMVTTWHNQFLGTDTDFHGWREAYEQFIVEAIS